jgi:hypothetical protein
MRRESEKIFSLSFPSRQGKGGGGAYPAVVRPFGAAAASGSGIEVSFFLRPPANRQHRAPFVRTATGLPIHRHCAPSDSWTDGGIPKLGWKSRRKKPGVSALSGLTET